MAKVRHEGTDLEIEVQQYLDSLEILYEKNPRDLPGSPDLVNRKEMWAIFIHGCYWHGHSCQKRRPIKNADYWNEKIDQNQIRDKQKNKELLTIGYSVLVLWGCEIKQGEFKKKLDSFLYPIIEEFILDKKQNEVTRIVKTNNSQLSRITLPVNTKWYHDPREAFDYAYLRIKERPKQVSGEIVKCVDLFSGCGGLSLGAYEACNALGKKHLSLLALDREEDPLNVYKINIPVKKTLEVDIENVLNGEIGATPTKEEKNLLKIVKGTQLLLAGAPCQDHSSLNYSEKKEKNKRNELYLKIARFVELQKPEHLIIENVPNVINDKGKNAEKTLSLINKLNYHVDSAIVDFSKIGIPQRRKRHVVVASRSKVFSIEKIIRKYEIIQPRSVGWAIDDIQKEQNTTIFVTPSKTKPENKRRIEFLFNNDLYDLPNSERPLCHQNDHSYVSMYGRLKPGEPAQTITSGFTSPGQGRYIHYNQKRTLTPHEAARIQYFPDFFNFDSVKKRTSLATLIGNAVPMKLSYYLCLELLS
jgi:DNA (cytosine-5)-methyltransferase 1